MMKAEVYVNYELVYPLIDPKRLRLNEKGDRRAVGMTLWTLSHLTDASPTAAAPACTSCIVTAYVRVPIFLPDVHSSSKMASTSCLIWSP